MALTLSLKGTTYSSLTIGKAGATIYQGTSAPNNSNGVSGDLYIYIAGGTSSIYQNQNGVWILAGGSGSITNIATGTGLTGGPITTTGTISMATSGVTAGTYGTAGILGSTTTSAPVITVDALGRITSASASTIVLSYLD